MVRRGFSLVEVIVAMTLLSIGMLAVAGSALVAVQMLNGAQQRATAVGRATSMLDSLVANNVHGQGSASHGIFSIEWTADEDTVSVRLQAPDSVPFAIRALR